MPGDLYRGAPPISSGSFFFSGFIYIWMTTDVLNISYMHPMGLGLFLQASGNWFLLPETSNLKEFNLQIQNPESTNGESN